MVFIQIEEECCCSDATNVGSAVFVAVVVVIVVVVGFTLRENKYVERENACLRREEEDHECVMKKLGVCVCECAWKTRK